MYTSSVLSCTIAPCGQAVRTALTARDRLARPGGERGRPELGRGQRSRAPAGRDGQLCGSSVEPGAVGGRAGAGGLVGAAEQRLQPYDHLLDVERLGHVVVAADAEAAQSVGRARLVVRNRTGAPIPFALSA